nr:DUF3306 domain-containing protein [Pigmentiphaga litoralis]
MGRWSRRKIEARKVEAAEAAAEEAAAKLAADASATDAFETDASATRASSTAVDSAYAPAPAPHTAIAADPVAPVRTDAGDASAHPRAVPAAAHTEVNRNANPDAPPLPTLADVAKLTADSDYSVFMAKGVAPEVKNAAMKKLFSDPHYNIMDGLDIYIDDYSSPEIMPQSMLRKMASARVLNLFTDEDEAKAVAADQAAAELAAAEVAAAQAATPASTPTPGTVTDESGSNLLPIEPTARPDDRLHVATAAPRAAADVLASAPRPDASRAADDGITPDSSQSGHS